MKKLYKCNQKDVSDCNTDICCFSCVSKQDCDDVCWMSEEMAESNMCKDAYE